MLRSVGRPDLAVAAFGSLVAAAIATAIHASSPIAHGAWLVAYLALVGFLAQALLGAGQTALLVKTTSSPLSRPVRLTQAGLWNLGVVAVALGVLSETRLLVVIGSVSLLAALISFWISIRQALASTQAGWLSRAYLGLLAGLMASVFVGTSLAWDLPWV
jgi:hypothetical protein